MWQEWWEDVREAGYKSKAVLAVAFLLVASVLASLVLNCVILSKLANKRGNVVEETPSKDIH